MRHTKQYLCNRIRQHKYDYNVVNSDKRDKTVLATHHCEDGDSFDFNKVTIMLLWIGANLNI